MGWLTNGVDWSCPCLARPCNPMPPSFPARSGMNAFAELKRNPELRGGWVGGRCRGAGCGLGRPARLRDAKLCSAPSPAAPTHPPLTNPPTQPPYPPRPCLLQATPPLCTRWCLPRGAAPMASSGACSGARSWAAGWRPSSCRRAPAVEGGGVAGARVRQAAPQRCARASAPRSLSRLRAGQPAQFARLPSRLQAVNNRVVHRSNYFLQYDGGARDFQYQVGGHRSGRCGQHGKGGPWRPGARI